MFEDFLMNGKTSGTLEDSISNNLMNEDSLLSNIIMREELTDNILVSDNTISDNVKDVENIENSAIKNADRNGKDNNFGLSANSLKKDTVMQVDCAETQSSCGNNFANVLKNDTTKNEEKNTTTKNLMLAELLEKNSDKKEPPVLNGAIRLGEKGLELITKDELQRNSKTTFSENSVICSNKKVSNFNSYLCMLAKFFIITIVVLVEKYHLLSICFTIYLFYLFIY